MKVKRSDLFSGLLIIVLGFVFFASTLKIKPAKLGLSPADFPRLVTIAMMICGAGLVLKSLLSKMETSKRQIDLHFIRNFLGLVGIFIAYIGLLDKIGFLYLTPFFVFGSAYIFGLRKFYLNILLSLGTTIAVYYIFSKIFFVPLPHFSL
ncbi:MAG TPA: tripartite tricarboxylate transporter TctB family protein [Pseudothermotoga sp.]|nr:tripartite tricarboxylate transporter TctB family protein [Pseudothermotoga sp.]HOK83068.1 tripartite tricarboxylate transporter TctB family protein [Pseudothermotoga sp.]HPP69761.1 tripartite tricarboxylate transporter TctB family protein [Pseudothermotoga sp.]